VALLGVAYAAGMILYASLYVLRIELNGDRLLIDTVAPLGHGVLRHNIGTDELCPQDVNNMAAHLCAHVVYEMLVLLCRQSSLAPGLTRQPWTQTAQSL
jgi:hypothetical protein